MLGGDFSNLTSTQQKIYRLYGVAFNRQPDLQGFVYQTNTMDGGMSLQTITANFLNSPEFQQTYGALNNTQFVTLLYNNALNRTPDSEGLNYWVTQLNSGVSRADVVDGFSESSEYVGKTTYAARGFARTSVYAGYESSIYRLYGMALNRPPDPTGFQYQVNTLASGTSLASVAANFVASGEFANLYGGLDNTQFVSALYTNGLHRQPDAAGLSYCVTQLNSGASRANVVASLSESAEYQSLTSSSFSGFMSSQMPMWNDVMSGGGGTNTMVGCIGSTDYVFNSYAPGNDHIYGLETWDTLTFTNFGYANAAAAMAHMTQTGSDVAFSDRGETAVFHNTTLAQVGAAHFIL